jgi:predicted phage-related endonuclease
MRYQITKPEHGSQEWLNVRWVDENGLTRISASVASAVHNENKYTSAADLAMELLADAPPTPQPTNSAMDRGNYMEPVLIKWTADVEGINLTTPDVMYCYNEHGARLIATLDAIDDNGIPYEVKTTNKKFTGVLPREWHWQGVQQAICAGSETIEWIIFDNEMQIKRYTQNISSDDREYHIFKCQEFLADIDNGAVPAAAKLEYKHVESMYPESTAKQMALPSEASVIIEQLDKVREMSKALAEQESELKTQLGTMMQDAEEGTIDGNVVVTWKTQSRTSFDQKKFEAEHPALVPKFRKTSTFRVMKTRSK